MEAKTCSFFSNNYANIARLKETSRMLSLREGQAWEEHIRIVTAKNRTELQSQVTQAVKTTVQQQVPPQSYSMNYLKIRNGYKGHFIQGHNLEPHPKCIAWIWLTCVSYDGLAFVPVSKFRLVDYYYS